MMSTSAVLEEDAVAAGEGFGVADAVADFEAEEDAEADLEADAGAGLGAGLVVCACRTVAADNEMAAARIAERARLNFFTGISFRDGRRGDALRPPTVTLAGRDWHLRVSWTLPPSGERTKMVTLCCAG